MKIIELSDPEISLAYGIIEKEYNRLEILIAPPNQAQGTRERRIEMQNTVSGILDALKSTRDDQV